jgi:hypothetical protein
MRCFLTTSVAVFTEILASAAYRTVLIIILYYQIMLQLKYDSLVDTIEASKYENIEISCKIKMGNFNVK